MSNNYIYRIQEVTTDEINRVVQWFCDKVDGKLSTTENVFRGLYLAACDNGAWLAVDNLDGHAWTEAFTNKDAAMDWLRDYK